MSVSGEEVLCVPIRDSEEPLAVTSLEGSRHCPSTIGLAGYGWLYVSERDTTRNLASVNAPYLYDTKRSNKRNLCERHSTTVRPGAILTGDHIALSWVRAFVPSLNDQYHLALFVQEPEITYVAPNTMRNTVHVSL